MADSHICLSCGLDLARVRAVVEPVYGLSLVACPGCAAGAVRREDSVTAAWRTAVRFASALGAMIFRLGAGAALMAASVGFVYGAEAVSAELGVTVLDLPGAAMEQAARRGGDAFAVLGVVAVWLGVEVGVGVLLTAGLRHWRPRWRVWGAWAVLLLVLLSVEPLLFAVQAPVGRLVGDPVVYEGPGPVEWLTRWALGLGALVAAAAGIPVGMGLIWLGWHVDRWRFRWRRRRMRAGRGKDR
jgi:hypothetical protein